MIGGRDVAPWPTYSTMLRVERARMFYLRRRVRVALQYLRALRFRHLIDNAVRRAPWLRGPLALHPVLFRPVIGAYLDIRVSSIERRISQYAHDLEFTSTRIQVAYPSFFSTGMTSMLWQPDGSEWLVELGMNTEYPQEGLWRISLCSRSHG